MFHLLLLFEDQGVDRGEGLQPLRHYLDMVVVKPAQNLHHLHLVDYSKSPKSHRAIVCTVLLYLKLVVSVLHAQPLCYISTILP